MKILLDMNLSPDWVQVLQSHGLETIHWSTVGDPRAKDTEIMDWARSNGYIVFTHDLDFGTILAATQAESPSVIQIRTQDVLRDEFINLLLESLKTYESLIEEGALIVIDEARVRARILPLNR